MLDTIAVPVTSAKTTGNLSSHSSPTSLSNGTQPDQGQREATSFASASHNGSRAESGVTVSQFPTLIEKFGEFLEEETQTTTGQTFLLEEMLNDSPRLSCTHSHCTLPIATICDETEKQTREESDIKDDEMEMSKIKEQVKEWREQMELELVIVSNRVLE